MANNDARENTTLTGDLIIPDVWADLIQAEFTRKSALLGTPIVVTDDQLAGQPGDTVTFPKWTKLGEMQEVQELEEPQLGKLSQTKTRAKIKGVGSGYQFTDDARLIGLGDIQAEGTRQLGIRYAEKVDADLIKAAIDVVPADRQAGLEKSEAKKYDDQKATGFSWGLFVDAIASLGDPTRYTSLIIRSEAQAALMKDDQFINASKLGATTPLLTGQIGVLAGVPVQVVNSIPENTALLVKPGALALKYKQRPTIETERVPGKRLNRVWFHSKYAAARRDDNGVLVITHKAPGAGAAT